MSTHHIPYSIHKRKSAEIIPNLQLLGFFSKGLKKRVRNSHGVRAVVGVKARRQSLYYIYNYCRRKKKCCLVLPSQSTEIIILSSDCLCGNLIARSTVQVRKVVLPNVTTFFNILCFLGRGLFRLYHLSQKSQTSTKYVILIKVYTDEGGIK